jgi:hypothetical protein
MAPGYKVKLISPKEKERLMARLCAQGLHERKALIHGTCVKLFTDSHDFKDMWEDNFEQMPDWIRPHARLFAVKGRKLSVRYEPLSKTAIVEGCTYYGWVKSIALALVADFMEDFTSEHRRYSVHGSFIDRKGKGMAIIGPSGSGKTTLTYGLLLDKQCSFVTDDWFFVRMADGSALVYASEKNSYIRGNLGRDWPEYRQKLKGMKKDAEERAIVDVSRLLGPGRTRAESSLSLVVLLTRDRKLPVLRRLKPEQALAFMLENDFCNPHQLVRTKAKKDKRKAFFKELFSRAPVYLLNTIESPQRSLDRIKNLIAQDD